MESRWHRSAHGWRRWCHQSLVEIGYASVDNYTKWECHSDSVLVTEFNDHCLLYWFLHCHQIVGSKQQIDKGIMLDQLSRFRFKFSVHCSGEHTRVAFFVWIGQTRINIWRLVATIADTKCGTPRALWFMLVRLKITASPHLNSIQRECYWPSVDSICWNCAISLV